MGLVVLGLQQAGVWGWTDPKTIGAIVVGIVLLVLFVASELREREPLIRVRLFEHRGFAVDNAVLLLMSAVFVPFFFFASVYAQAALGFSATNAGPVPARLLRRLRDRGAVGRADRRQARRPPGRHPRLRPLGGRLLPVGPAAPRPRVRQPVVLGRRRRRRARARAGPGEHRRAEPRAGRRLRRGHRHHPDRAQPGRQPRPGRHGIAVRQRQRRPGRLHAAQQRRARRRRPTASRTRSPRAGTPVAAAGSRRRPVPAPTRSCTPSRSTSPSPPQTVVWIMAGIMAAAFIVSRLLPKAAPVPTAEEPAEQIDAPQQVLHEA